MLVFILTSSKWLQSGYMYDLQNCAVELGVRLDREPVGKISDINRDNVRYSINYLTTKCFDKILTLNKWKYTFNHIWGHFESASIINTFYMYYTVDKSKPDQHNIITITYSEICSEEAENFFKKNPNWKLVPITDWDVPPGFIHNKYFHFFDVNKIYLFEDQMYENSEIILNSTFKVVPAKDFFICNSHPKPIVPITYPPITTNSESKLWLDFQFQIFNISI